MANYSETILLRETHYSHDFDGAGKTVKCGGRLDIVQKRGQVQVICRTCSKGWSFKFIYGAAK